MKLSESAANFLTNSAYDPDSKIPEYKVCAVRIEPISVVRQAHHERDETRSW